MKILMTIFLLAFSFNAVAGNDDISSLVQLFRTGQYQLVLKNLPITLHYETRVRCPNYDENGNCLPSGVSYIATGIGVWQIKSVPVEEFNIHCDVSWIYSNDVRKTLPQLADLGNIQFRYDKSCQQADCRDTEEEFSKNVYFKKAFQTLNVEPSSVTTHSAFNDEGIVLAASLPDGNIQVSCGSGYDSEEARNADIEKRPRLTLAVMNEVLKDLVVLQKK